MNTQNHPHAEVLSTGIPGLDTSLCGGLTANRIYLLEGEPGAGKNTTGMQFLLKGARCGESDFYITPVETAVEWCGNDEAHSGLLEDIHSHEVLPPENLPPPEAQCTMFHPSEVEMGTATQTMLRVIDERKPSRVVLDSLSGLQLLTGKQFFSSRDCTVLLLDDRTSAVGDRA